MQNSKIEFIKLRFYQKFCIFASPKRQIANIEKWKNRSSPERWTLSSG